MNRRTIKNLIFFFLGLFFAVGVLGFASSVLAQTPPDVSALTPSDLGLEQVSSTIGLPSTDIRLVIARIIRVALGLLGIVAVVLVIYGGFIWMTAGGNEEKIGQAKKILVNAVIGLAIILSAYAIVSFVVNKLVGATTGTEQTNDRNDEGCVGADCFNGGALAFYVNSLPTGGVLCIRNIHLSIDFSREVNLATLDGKLALLEGGNTPTPGHWVHGENGNNKNTAVFVPDGDCGDGGIQDCLKPNTNYALHFFPSKNLIESLDNPRKFLQCSPGYKPCSDVVITTGAGVDRVEPTITINYPTSSSPLSTDDVVPVNVSFTDDNGVQSVKIKSDGHYVDTARIQGCQKTGSVTINWPTNGLQPTLHRLSAIGMDWSGLTDEKWVDVTLRPAHCFNQLKDTGEEDIDCGLNSGCGRCEGSECTANEDCASGFCEIPTGQTKGVCVNRTRITGITPESGAPGSFVSVNGYYFGNQAGHVYFSKISGTPQPDNPSDWIEGNIVNCGSGFDSWTPWQIIAELPKGAYSGPIKVDTVPIVGKDGKTRQFTDTTADSDGWGPALTNFEVTSQVRPGLCGVTPDTSGSGANVVAVGKNFGDTYNPQNKVDFGGVNAQVDTASWRDAEVSATVPILDKGNVGVSVTSFGVKSNSVRFVILGGMASDTPAITYISPDHGAKGEYITIRGKNFGSQQGEVWFKYNGAYNAYTGDFNFPADCKTSVWSDKQIIVKFPFWAGTAGVYSIQVKAGNTVGDKGPMFNLEAGQPNPGICKIDPSSGPIPFSSGGSMMVIGEYFGDSPQVFFWRTGASSTATDDRVAGGVSLVEAASGGGQKITITPPVQTKTGPVVAHRPGDPNNKISNALGFEVWDCVKNKGCNLQDGSGNDYKCCAAGADTGVCRAPSELCAGETRSTGYLWRFCTKDIPPVPRVVERCDGNTDLGLNLPSPSPSVLWGSDHRQVCRTASLVVEFNLGNINPISQSNFVVYECVSSSAIYESKRFCETKEAGTVPIFNGTITPQLSAGYGATIQSSYLELFPDASYNTGKWKDNTWYQVVLKSAISSGSGTSTAFLAKDKPCADDPNSAYCFLFKTGHDDCKMRDIIITPYRYWTSVLEAPMKYRPPGGNVFDLFYKGHGLSEQKCILMDVKGFDWAWSTNPLVTPPQPPYADIFSGANTRDKVQASALANTVGVDLSNNAVNIHAEATTGTKTYAKDSPLTIDLSNPQVVDYWPKCLETCANAEVAVKFNTTMSNSNLGNAITNGSVKILKCLDENCQRTSPDTNIIPADIYLDQSTGYTVLKIANSQANSAELATNTIYQIKISAKHTPAPGQPNVFPNTLWSAAYYNVPSSFSKPFNQEFTWRFRTKKEKCKIDRVEVLPKVFTAYSNKAKAIFAAQPFSAPDSCDSRGQKLNPWAVSWDWTSLDTLVANVTQFTTRGKNPYCTGWCVRKGSDIPAGGVADNLPVCGNGKVEAGEDCDPPDKATGCNLDCRSAGNLNEGSSQTTKAVDVNTSICGNGFIGAGEDCDFGISGLASDPQSAMGCSEKCLHQGTRLSTKWCFDYRVDHGGFATASYLNACDGAYSQCGDKVANPDEDQGCDDLSTGWNETDCDNYCLLKTGNDPGDVTIDNKCDRTPLPQGCDPITKKHVGSSLLYATPSVCGDGLTGLGENFFCEDKLVESRNNLINPWALATAVGIGVPTGEPPSQQTDIKTDTTVETKIISGSGKFVIPCGYQSDAECRQAFGLEYGVGSNSCCYARPKLVKIYPGSTSTKKEDICPNTFIEATFDKKMDETSLADNVLIARGVSPGTMAKHAGSLASGSGPLSAPYLKYPRSVFVLGSYAYVVSYASSSLEIMDISNPTLPKHVSVLKNGEVIPGDGKSNGAKLSDPFSVFVFGNYAYVVGDSNGALEIIDISNPTLPKHVSVLKNGEVIPGDGKSNGAKLSDPFSVFVFGNYAYVVGDSNGALEIIDISNPTLPKHVSVLKNGEVIPGDGLTTGAELNGPFSVFVSGNYVYVASGNSNALEIVDISSSTKPKHVSALKNGEVIPGDGLTTGAELNRPMSVFVSGNYAYLASYFSNALEIVDISSSTMPVHKGSLVNNDEIKLLQPRSVFVSKNYAFVASIGRNALEIVDVSSSTLPVHAGSISDGAGSAPYLESPYSVFVSGNYAYVISYTKHTLEVVDISGVINNCLVGGPNDVSSLMALSTVPDSPNSPWYKKVLVKIAQFFRRLFGGEATATPGNPDRWCTGSDWGYPEVVNTAGTLDRIRVKLTKPLSFNSDYAIILKDGLRDSQGVSTATTTKWRFVTGSKICEVDKVNVDPDQYYYSRAYSTSSFETQTFSDNKQQIQSVLGYAWEFLWGPKASNIITFPNTSATTTTNTIRSENRNGETDAWASANVTDNKYTFRKGIMATGRTHLIVFLCENPWPPVDLYLDNGGSKTGPFAVFPYEDKIGNNDNFNLALNNFDNTSLPEAPFGKFFNFSTYYCADAGAPGTADDLPYLRPAVQTSTRIISATSTLKRFIFSSYKNDDGIGVQVLNNADHLTARQWFNFAKQYGGQGFAGEMQDVKINGYNAITDGNNVYVDAANLNFSDAPANTHGSVYSNIYLFSVNANAKAETRQVFSQMMNNLKFNINLTNYGYCAPSVTTAGTTTPCATDFDCTAPEVCAVQADKLKRDYQRLRDINYIQQALLAKAPKAVSVWHFDEGYGTSTADSNGGFKTEISNTTSVKWVAGKTGQALEFDGTANGFVTVANSPRLSFPAGNFSWEAWVKSDGGGVIMAKGGSGSNAEYVVRINNVGGGLAQVGLFYKKNITAPAVTFGVSTWTHLALVVSDFNNKLKVYINGKFAAEGNLPTGSYPADHSLPLYFGKQGVPSYPYFTGALDEVRLYNRALSPLEIKEHYYGFYTESGAGAPKLAEGTYLPGQTLSVWPSWSVLGSAVGTGLPVDPINRLSPAGTCASSTGEFCTGNDPTKNITCSKSWCTAGATGTACSSDLSCGAVGVGKCALEKCVLHDAVTGWSTADRRFSFACYNTSSYAYRYEYNTSTGFIIYNKREGFGLIGAGGGVDNFADFSSFVDQDRSQGEICKGGKEITTLLNTVCGDGRVTVGKEECDPPGTESFNKTKCTALDGYKMDRSFCDATCHWQKNLDLDCKNLTKTCGNGKLDPGENCDDGVQNETYNHCATDCINRFAQRCGDGTAQAGKEICDIGTPNYNGSLWALLRQNSCSYDCQAYGPYCGDKIIQSPLESCDGSTACSVGGKSGQRFCNNSCQKTGQGFTEQWLLDKLTIISGTVTVMKETGEECVTGCNSTPGHTYITANKKVSTAVNGHDGNCYYNTTARWSTCPTLSASGEGRFGKAINFDGVGEYLRVPHDATLMSSTFSVEAWVKYNNGTSMAATILDKGGASSDPAAVVTKPGGYTLRYNSSNKKMQWIVWSPYNASVYAMAELNYILSNNWTHFVGTYDPQLNGELKLYIDGKLATTKTGTTANRVQMAATTTPLMIGAGINLQYPFKGSIDQISYYNYALNADEVVDHYQNGDWFCSTTERAVAVVASGCGDGKVDEGEACDQGALQNGLACNPQYNKACSYCSVDCKQRVEVQPKEFCGNGKIEGTEVCDTDPNDQTKIYANSRTSSPFVTELASSWSIPNNGYLVTNCVSEPPSTTYDRPTSPRIASYSISKGVKKCINSCTQIQPCTRCGNVEGGAVVEGRIINVLYPDLDKTGLERINLVINKTATWAKDVSNPVNIGHQYGRLNDSEIDRPSYYLRPRVSNPGAELNEYNIENYARLGSDPICSDATDGTTRHYQMVLNSDSEHIFDFPIVKVPTPEQYDLVLSPVIFKNDNAVADITGRPQDLRVVVSWTGRAGVSVGFMSQTSPFDTVYDTSYGQYLSTGTAYYEKTVTSYKKYGIWYHGFGQVINQGFADMFGQATNAQTNEVSFTLDSGSAMFTDRRLFIRSYPGPISSLVAKNLKVKIYKSEDYATADIKHMATPDEVYELINAAPSDNSLAKYWYVADIYGPATWPVCNQYEGIIVTDMSVANPCPP